MSTDQVRASNTGDAQPVVPTGQKPLADVPDALQPEHTICARVLLVVEAAEVAKVTLEDRVEVIPAPGDVAVT